jgi:hypothetical protein
VKDFLHSEVQDHCHLEQNRCCTESKQTSHHAAETTSRVAPSGDAMWDRVVSHWSWGCSILCYLVTEMDMHTTQTLHRYFIIDIDIEIYFPINLISFYMSDPIVFVV